MTAAAPPRPAGRILPTMNEDGSRRWLRPRPSHGKWYQRRRIVAWVLMLLYLSIPHIDMNGKPLILLDAPRREFTLFGYTFLPTDTLLFMLLLGTLILAVFTFTALFGRVWCGWACPQTVWMEFLYRPIERLFEGGRSGSLLIDKSGRLFHPRRLLKHGVYLVISLILAHTFLAYFVGVEALQTWVTRSPAEHPSSFAVMAVTTALVFLDFSYFREQTCTIACPYGRWQSVLLDRSSLVVAYDYNRGEPRHKSRSQVEGKGDCIDCSACVTTCPTGIDIRDGLQMECIHCTQCIDACDAIMDSVDRPRGLIRYTSRELLSGRGRHVMRPRTIIYPVALLAMLGAFVFQLNNRAAADVTILRSTDAPFRVENDGRVSNQVRVRIANRTSSDRDYRLTVNGADGADVIIPVNPLSVQKGKTETTSLFVVLPASGFEFGRHSIQLVIDDGASYKATFDYDLLGPTAPAQVPQ